MINRLHHCPQMPARIVVKPFRTGPFTVTTAHRLTCRLQCSERTTVTGPDVLRPPIVCCSMIYSGKVCCYLTEIVYEY